MTWNTDPALHQEKKRELPPGWRWVKLGEVCEQYRKIVHTKSELADSLPYLSLEHIEANTGRILKEPSMPMEDEGISTTFEFDNKHVLYGKLRPYLNKVALPTFRGRCTTEIIPLLPADGVNRAYLCWILRRSETVGSAMQEKTGSRMPRASMNELMYLEIPLPPLAEQKRIAAILNDQMAAVDRARTAARSQLHDANALSFVYLSESLKNGKTTEIRMQECLIEVSEGVGNSWAKLPVFGATRNGIAPAKEPVGKKPERYKIVDEGTIFYNPMRILIGSIAFVDEGDTIGITSPDYVVIKTRTGILHHRWFYYWLRSPYGENFIRSLARGAVRERMLFRRLATGMIRIPDWATQIQFAQELYGIRKLVSTIEAQLQEIEALPASLLNRAFNGEI